MKRKPALQHISEAQPEHVRPELTRNLLGQGSHSLVQWFGRNKMLAEQARVVAEAVLASPDAVLPTPRTAHTKPGDPAQLRGIPVVGAPGSFGGAIPGTQPEAELLARERHRSRLGNPE